MQLKVIHKAEHEEISKARAKIYLEKWPITKQLEAITEAFKGDTKKINELIECFENVRKTLPYLDNQKGT